MRPQRRPDRRPPRQWAAGEETKLFRRGGGPAQGHDCESALSHDQGKYQAEQVCALGVQEQASRIYKV